MNLIGESEALEERVARAIAGEYHCDPDALASGQIPQFLSHPRLGVHGAHLKFRDEDYLPVWRLFVPQARAAIAAMNPHGAEK